MFTSIKGFSFFVAAIGCVYASPLAWLYLKGPLGSGLHALYPWDTAETILTALSWAIYVVVFFLIQGVVRFVLEGTWLAAMWKFYP